MLQNKRFKLTRPALTVDAVSMRSWITIPAGGVIRVLEGPHGDENEMINILWQQQMLTMFAIDLNVGCEEVAETNTGGTRTPGLDTPARCGKDRSTRKRR